MYARTGSDVRNWYHNNLPAWIPGEKTAKLPGGANPLLAGQKQVGLGYDFTISTPIGDQTVSVPIEKLASDAGNMAAQAALPVLNDAVNKLVPGLIAQAIKQGEDAVVNQLWPQMQPKFQALIDDAIAQGKAEIRKDLAIAVVAIAITFVGGIALMKTTKSRPAKI